MAKSTDAVLQQEIGLEHSVSETALLTLFFKAKEMQFPKEERIAEDPKAQEILDALGVNMDRFQNKRWSQVGTLQRMRRLDNETSRFLQTHDRPIVVHLACGLDGRFARTDKGKGVQADLDFPDIIALRRRFYPENERNPQIAGSMLDTDWMDALKEQHKDAQFAFVMEGVLMYLKEEEVRGLFCNLADRFPGAELHFDAIAPWMAKNSGSHDSIREYKGKVLFSWGIGDPRDMEKWHPALRFDDVEYYFSTNIPRPWHRWGLPAMFLRYIPAFGKGGKICRFIVQPASTEPNAEI